jgi:hypothetical protein
MKREEFADRRNEMSKNSIPELIDLLSSADLQTRFFAEMCPARCDQYLTEFSTGEFADAREKPLKNGAVVERKTRENSKRNGETTVYNDCDEEQKNFFFANAFSSSFDFRRRTAASAQIKLVAQKISLRDGRKFNLNLPADYEIVPAAEGLRRPRFFAKAPDGRIFVTDMYDLTDNRRGAVYILDDWTTKRDASAR